MSIPTTTLRPASVRPLLIPPHPQNKSITFKGEDFSSLHGIFLIISFCFWIINSIRTFLVFDLHLFILSSSHLDKSSRFSSFDRSIPNLLITQLLRFILNMDCADNSSVKMYAYKWDNI